MSAPPLAVPSLAEAYEYCRRINAGHGASYYLATLLLPRWKRRHVHALYGFARYADEIVDGFDQDLSAASRAERLAAFGDRFFGWAAGTDRCADPVVPAVVHTVRAFDLDLADFRAFLGAMAADLEVARYAGYDDLLGYMEGSAAAIATMMLPVLESVDPARAREPARQLGLAFQLTNFIRDVAEDLARGRVYLPLADLDRFGVDADALAQPVASPAVRRLIAFEVDRARRHYAAARAGIELLIPSSRPCIRAAYELYGGILDEVVRVDHDVLGGRVRVPRARRAAIFARHLRDARAAARAEVRVARPR